MLDKKEKRRTAAFFYRKMPVVAHTPTLPEQGITAHDKLFCHAELGSASYQYGIILVFW